MTLAILRISLEEVRLISLIQLGKKLLGNDFDNLFYFEYLYFLISNDKKKWFKPT